ncbi:TetR/AcrR family transcriptional regulator [Fictibacillus nanhaiensis]|uniref:TetR/AcrR family transcriptional regulator n=1 Tax=Fictibacillus nanhaiensis TaxID=742169 RepID=UPI001C952A6F|nr:TetR/AcrR family transcriptional regulator [Fictibacillus nanhaiensis]MBY6036492.1 TetR/AcrR family transcriptional regulator [Fictibacillus nanhaiensis]
MNGYERRKIQKQTDIKKAAFTLFQKQGFKDIKIEDLAKEAGVSQVTIYNHFGSKEALFREVVKDYTREQYEFHKELMESDLPFQEKMKAMILHKTKQVASIHPEALKEMLLNDLELREYFADFQKKYSAPMILKGIKEAQQKGEINPDLSEQAIVIYIQLFNNDMLISQITAPNGKKLAADIFHMFLYGLTKPQELE